MFNKSIVFLITFTIISAFSLNLYAENFIKSSHFDVIYYTGTHEYAEDIAGMAEASLREISVFLRYRLENSIKIVLTRDYAQFKTLTSGTLPDWSAAAAIGDKIIMTPPGHGNMDEKRIIPHEIAHCLLNEASGGGYIPRWFHEGFAELFSGRIGLRNELYIVWQVSKERELTFADIEKVFSKPEMDASLAYDQSAIAVNYLISIHGKNIISDIAKTMRSGRDFHRAFYESTGVWPMEFEKAYVEYMRNKFGKETLFMLIPGIWTIILIIALIVFIYKVRKNRKTMARWEEIENNEKIIDIETYRDERNL